MCPVMLRFPCPGPGSEVFLTEMEEHDGTEFGDCEVCGGSGSCPGEMMTMKGGTGESDEKDGDEEERESGTRVLGGADP